MSMRNLGEGSTPASVAAVKVDTAATVAAIDLQFGVHGYIA